MRFTRAFSIFFSLFIFTVVFAGTTALGAQTDLRESQGQAGSIPEQDEVPLRNWAVPLPVATLSANGTIVPMALPSAASHFIAIAPCRVVDTRDPDGAFGGPGFAANETRAYNIAAGPCGGIPAAAAYSLNFTLVSYDVSSGGFVTAFPSGGARPFVSTVNFGNGTNAVANAAIVPANGGSIDVFISGATNLIIDINGYFAEGVVSSLNAASGAVTISGAGATTVSTAGNAITVTTPVDPGGVLPAGTDGQTLRHNGTAWVPNNSLTSNGTDVTLNGSLVVPTAVRMEFATGIPFLHRSGGSSNTFVGFYAGNEVTTGADNTATGMNALRHNTTGFSNTANGSSALGLNVTGANNTAVGHFALWVNRGDNNTAVGRSALGNNNTGSNNIALGSFAGADVAAAGSSNILLGSRGSSADVNTIRIGGTSQTRAFLAGVSGITSASGVQVLINAAGQLGTTTSSATVKKDIVGMSEQTSALLKLRPVSFLYRSDTIGVRQYGLIAEEVAEVMPELVQFSPEGEAETVRYHFLAPLLLSEIQKQQHTIDDQRLTNDEQHLMIVEQRNQITELRREKDEQRLINEEQRKQITTIKARLAALEK